MGNSTTLPYDIIEPPIDYSSNNHWTLNQGSKKSDKDNMKQNVSIFRFHKLGRSDRLHLAQKNVQKLRTIRHPYVVSYVDSLETEDVLLLVTEQIQPVEQWLAKLMEDPNYSTQQNMANELTWGFKCILKALDFLHSNCNLIHGNLGLNSIFVTQNGDWKIAAFDIACNVNVVEDLNVFVSNHNILDSYFIAPERTGLRPGDFSKIESTLKAKVPPYYIDIFSWGQCITKAFRLVNAELSGSLSKHVQLTNGQDIKKRPTASKLIQTANFNSDYIKVLENVQEFSLKGPKEVLEAIKDLDPLLPIMTTAICTHKLLPSVCKVMQISVNDFQNRDARESCRQSLLVCIELLSKLGNLKKLDDNAFHQECVPILIQLWAMTDRTIRTALLSSLKQLSDLLSSQVINRSLFDNILAGFSDSNAKLRESTLMSLIYIVDKLEENQLQDRLVKCVLNLQNDGEASIRTNTTIFIGKIASKLKDSVRARMLCGALAKSMKDNFLHCRIAGLKTSIACVKFMDVTQLATKIIPQCAILLLDKSKDVRGLAISLMEVSMDRMKQHHDELSQTADRDGSSNRDDEQRRQSSQQAPSTAAGASSGGNILNSPAVLDTVNSWTSWSIQGISKTIDGDAGSEKRIGELPMSINKKKDSASQSHPPYSPSVTPNTSKAILDNDSDNLDEYFETKSFGNSRGDNDNDNNGSGGDSFNNWGDELDDALNFDDENDDDAKPSTSTSSISKSKPSIGTASHAAATGAATGGGAASISSLSSKVTAASSKTGTTGSTKAAKVAVKKLEFTDDDWEDF